MAQTFDLICCSSFCCNSNLKLFKQHADTSMYWYLLLQFYFEKSFKIGFWMIEKVEVISWKSFWIIGPNIYPLEQIQKSFSSFQETRKHTVTFLFDNMGFESLGVKNIPCLECMNECIYHQIKTSYINHQHKKWASGCFYKTFYYMQWSDTFFAFKNLSCLLIRLWLYLWFEKPSSQPMFQLLGFL